ncbi:MAG: hypothetical protein UR39_C0006G0044 [Candidatus Woesebacteria bacterium GW2011_GWA1_33_30]|uniref:DUF2130 domain-containing protein n=1 Tax=Candidatus Woesebacteria bacterium GW2011_GWA2_33_28 TaxID=1618561 RepID=A0A0G0CUI3_9BACT|nr:MAG: hypothetical protein UR38_C0006G0010 [Candidatus Woesebacteria bacterium GW2011_GWA2_33_28]KKP47888.1 MAG: hypothetical protein UR39_C0006G0044 [Candidatus Woesebacteria bacterium GW2011_GWA1_33_30]KKP49330.1 MAG: hypothetical protein UR40_C0007G0043 [Microgenomates group bacterium GW2011_GWC1_33_32]KKP52041.1 MAG: hypothetical protein UR44_C0005G0044 [Candidatus Woesebacteria bacterium GW2011_GWB1_33_38]KKP57310.1 MAG: hypothetical protein UR48_C0020G0006 [Microgenomates group bacteriu
MANTIKCKNCGTVIDVAEELAHDIKESVGLEERRKARVEIDKYLDEIKALREKDETREIEMKKKLLEDREKIKEEERQRIEDEHKLKDLENFKKMQDVLKANEELKRKLEQGSQQTQGESLELTLEEELKKEFPQDTISEVKKGVKGADLLQEVVDKLNRNCGTIIWESKNAKWSDIWISKLKEDQRQAKADLAVLVSVNLSEDLKQKGMGFKNGVWICNPSNFILLAMSLRFNLVNIYHEKQNGVNVDEKMKVLYEYLTGNEFKLRVEGIVESFSILQDDIEREKRWFSSKWARQEKEIRKVIDHTHGMYGDLQGVTGRALPEIKSLELKNENE